jgi:membrane protein implicated in regulation of membrane protease activity
MRRRMMLGIKELAEAKIAADRPLIPTTSDYIWFFSILGSGLLILIMLFARRWPGRLLTAVCLSALLTLVLYWFPPVPLSGIALAFFTLLILIWRVWPSHPLSPRPQNSEDADGNRL